MTSKEALDNWYNTQSPRTKAYEYELHYRLIKKDLKVLEILKKLEWEVYENGGGDNWNWFVGNKQSMKITDKDAQLLKVMTGAIRSMHTAIIWRTVLILPLIAAAMTMPSEAATVLTPATRNSLASMIISIQPGTGSGTIRQNAE